MISKGLFVTGTDTEVGKTRISVGLMQAYQQQGLKVAGMKPIASGCIWQQQAAQWQNEDALAIQQQSNVTLPYELINPYAFEPAIAPHLAASQQDVTISLAEITKQYEAIQQQADMVIVEGAGGWLVPINDNQTMADLAVSLALPVVLVVSIKLGCINHALLSVQAIEQSGLKLHGWVANHLSEQSQSVAMIDTLTKHIDAPCLGVVPVLKSTESVAGYLS